MRFKRNQGGAAASGITGNDAEIDSLISSIDDDTAQEGARLFAVRLIDGDIGYEDGLITEVIGIVIVIETEERAVTEVFNAVIDTGARAKAFTRAKGFPPDIGTGETSVE
eukprot:gene30954-11263_t